MEEWSGGLRESRGGLTGMLAERVGSGLDRLRFKSCLLTYMLAVCPWAVFSTSLCLSYLFYKIGIIQDNNRVLPQRIAINIS